MTIERDIDCSLKDNLLTREDVEGMLNDNTYGRTGIERLRDIRRSMFGDWILPNGTGRGEWWELVDVPEEELTEEEIEEEEEPCVPVPIDKNDPINWDCDIIKGEIEIEVKKYDRSKGEFPSKEEMAKVREARDLNKKKREERILLNLYNFRAGKKNEVYPWETDDEWLLPATLYDGFNQDGQPASFAKIKGFVFELLTWTGREKDYDY